MLPFGFRDRVSVIAHAILLLLMVSCSHYRGAYSHGSDHAAAAIGDLAVAGVFERSPSGEFATSIASEATAQLAQEAKAPDLSGQVSHDEALLLLSESVELRLYADRLQELQTRLGHRYLLVGVQGGTSVLHDLYWDVAVVIPVFYTIIFFDIPVNMKTTPDSPRSLRLVRLVDLESASVLRESCEVMRSEPGAKGFDRGQLQRALTEMKLRGK